MLRLFRHLLPLLPITLSLSLTSEPASAASIGIVSPDDPQYETLAAEWWQYVMSVPFDVNPLEDRTGENALQEQSGEPIFLVGLSLGASGAVHRTITVPTGTSFFFPVITAFAGCPSEAERNEWEEGLAVALDEPVEVFDALSDVEISRLVAETFITEGAIEPSLSVTIDGERVPDITSFRAESDTFTLTDLDYLGIEGTCEGVTADGYWILTEPITEEGTYVIRIAGTVVDPYRGLSGDFNTVSVHVTYTIHVVEP